MILVDTSAWVEYLRGADTGVTARVREVLSTRTADVVICEPVAMELLAGAADDLAVARLERLTSGLPSLALEQHLDFRAAATLFRQARRQGETVRSLVDCLVAAIALRHDATVLHIDRDFDVLGRLVGLRQVSCLDSGRGGA